MLFGGKERSSPSPSTSRRFGRTGQRFKIGARVLHNRRPAKIARMNRDRTFNIKYMDGDGEVKEGVEKSELSINSEPDSRQEKTISVGSRVEASRLDKIFPGKVTRVHSDGTFDILLLMTGIGKPMCHRAN